MVSAVAGLLVAALAPSVGAQETYDKSKNVSLIDDIQYTGGTELAADGKYVYTGELNGETNRNTHPKKGGLHVIDVSGKKPKEVGFMACPGTDNDVEVLRPGIVVMGFSNNQCAPEAGNGFMTIDVSDPKNPIKLGSIMTNKTHTLKPFPGGRYVYTAGGGLNGSNTAGPAIVDVKDPRKPKVVKTFQTYTMDCHDISFHVSKDKKLGFCAGAVGSGQVQIWDVSDPVNPTLLSEIVNPVMQYTHYAVASSDGNYLAIDDEAFALHECHTGQSPTGRVWLYDISNPQVPVPFGSMAAPRGGRETAGIGNYAGWVDSWCLSHGLDWMPGTHNLAVTWFTGGWSVITVDGQSPTPTEVAYFMAPDSATYSALWHDGKLYTNDMHRGLDAFTIKGLK
jgi:WD40 repeat protein